MPLYRRLRWDLVKEVEEMPITGLKIRLRLVQDPTQATQPPHLTPVLEDRRNSDHKTRDRLNPPVSTLNNNIKGKKIWLTKCDDLRSKKRWTRSRIRSQVPCPDRRLRRLRTPAIDTAQLNFIPKSPLDYLHISSLISLDNPPHCMSCFVAFSYDLGSTVVYKFGRAVVCASLFFHSLEEVSLTTPHRLVVPDFCRSVRMICVLLAALA